MPYYIPLRENQLQVLRAHMLQFCQCREGGESAQIGKKRVIHEDLGESSNGLAASPRALLRVREFFLLQAKTHMVIVS